MKSYKVVLIECIFCIIMCCGVCLRNVEIGLVMLFCWMGTLCCLWDELVIVTMVSVVWTSFWEIIMM